MTTTIKDITPPAVKAQQSADINTQIMAFLEKGGEIEKVAGFGEKSRTDLSIQASKDRHFA